MSRVLSLTCKGPIVLTKTFQCLGRFLWCQFSLSFLEIKYVNLVYQYKNGDFYFYFITTVKVEVMEQKGFLKGRVGSAGNGQNKPQEIPFFNFNRRILLLISKRVQCEIFI